MTFGRYLEGVALLGVIVVALGFGAVSLRSRLLPGWSGALARLAESLLAVGGLIGISTLLGAVGVLSLAPLVVACVAAGAIAVWLGSRRPRDASADPAPPAPASDRLALAGAGVAVLVLAAQWTRVMVAVFHGGMHYFDSLAYHMPISARIAQDGSLFHLFFVEQDPLTSSYPANAELLHAVAFLLLERDFFSPFINAGWLALALLAAWCVGRRWGQGPNALIAVSVLLATPVLLATAPGESTNDVMALALLLAAAAFVLNSDSRPAPLALAGLATGLALGTRLGVVFPVLAFCAGVLVVIPRRAIPAFAGPVVAAGGFWYLRNLVLVGNPLPALDVNLGPVSLPHVDSLYTRGSNTATIARYATDGSFWSDHFLPGLHSALGDCWPVIVAAGLAGAVLALLRARGAVRALGAVALVCMLAYAVTPGSAAAAGNLLYINVRYVFPGLVLGLAILPIDRWLAPAWRQRLLCAGLLVTLIVTVASPGSPWVTQHTRWALAGAAGVAIAILAFALHQRRPLPRAAVALSLVALAVAGVGLSWQEAKIYDRARYLDPPAVGNPLVDLWRSMAPAQGARIGFANLHQTYPLYGPALANRVGPIGRSGPHGAFGKARSCSEFVRAVHAGRYRFVVVSPPDFPDTDPGGTPRETRWMSRLSGTRVVYRFPPLRITVFEVAGPLGDEGCRVRGSR